MSEYNTQVVAEARRCQSPSLFHLCHYHHHLERPPQPLPSPDLCLQWLLQQRLTLLGPTQCKKSKTKKLQQTISGNSDPATSLFPHWPYHPHQTLQAGLQPGQGQHSIGVSLRITPQKQEPKCHGCKTFQFAESATSQPKDIFFKFLLCKNDVPINRSEKQFLAATSYDQCEEVQKGFSITEQDLVWHPIWVCRQIDF